jgi:hypothetical protein
VYEKKEMEEVSKKRKLSYTEAIDGKNFCSQEAKLSLDFLSVYMENAPEKIQRTVQK